KMINSTMKNADSEHKSRAIEELCKIFENAATHAKRSKGLDGVRTVKLTDPKSHYGAGHQNLEAVLEEVKRLGLPKLE
ncbi:MAG: hypothetical protein ACLP1D_26715, partial [Xanthobacteraceae bacterium]